MKELDQTITSLDDALKYVREKHLKDRFGAWIFRGVSKYDYEMKPKVGRNVPKDMSVFEFEKGLIDIFKRESRPYIGNNISNEYEWLALAQHHGLPTRLLDWTFNPFVALYFATKSDHRVDGGLVALNAEKKLSPDRLDENKPFELKKPYKILPNVVTRRIQSQQGLFVIINQPEQSLETCCPEDWTLVKWRIPAKYKKKIKYDLFRIGFDEARMFPDLDGLTSHLES